LFTGLTVKGAYQFRVTRNSELFVDEEEVENLASALKDELIGRGFRPAVRLEIAETCPKSIVKILLENFNLPENAVYRINGPVNLNRVTQVYELVNRPELKFPKFKSRHELLDEDCPFNTISEGDVLLHHPYDSFSHVLDLLQYASNDPQVLAIKQTLYRTGKDSKIIEYLVNAARNGKDVTVVVELRARFDEEANLNLADRLQEAGVQVMYGVVGYKTHAKMMLVTRREGKHYKRYAHLSTGNYNPVTARFYTDISHLTADTALTSDIEHVFIHLAGQSRLPRMNRLWMAPLQLHRKLLEKIESLGAAAAAGQPARIVAKMNALTDEALIRALIAAGKCGVKIDLIVRGACMLPAQVPGETDNIRVRSIIGRFLEHARVFYFAQGETEELYLSSADWMNRNMLRRVELAWPVLDPVLRQRIVDECLVAGLHDSLDAWDLQPDGHYERAQPSGSRPAISAQNALMARYAAREARGKT